MNALPGIPLDSVQEGDTLFADKGFTCMVSGPKMVRADRDGRLWVQCGDGKHYLDGQEGEAGVLIGFTSHWKKTARQGRHVVQKSALG